MTTGEGEALAVELAHVLNGALQQVAKEHEALVRRACNVPADMPVTGPVIMSMLAHCLSTLHEQRGRAFTDARVKAILDEFDALPLTPEKTS